MPCVCPCASKFVKTPATSLGGSKPPGATTSHHPCATKFMLSSPLGRRLVPSPPGSNSPPVGPLDTLRLCTRAWRTKFIIGCDACPESTLRTRPKVVHLGRTPDRAVNQTVIYNYYC
eukprot:scaffold22504_cov32-Tisochrysis_lutea.AAC.1